MDLPTYTRIWRIEKRLYKLYDFRLPVPVSLVTIGVFVGTSVVWCLLMGLLGVPFQTPWHVVWLVPPGVITFLATRPVIEGKSLTELLRSQLVYAAEARVYTRLAPEYESDRVVVTARVWRRDPAAGPLPALGGQTARSAEQQRAPHAEAAEPEAVERPDPAGAPEPAGSGDAPAAEPVAAHHFAESGRDAGERRAPRPPLSRRVLNYFGFGLRPEPPSTAGEEPPALPRPEPGAAADRRAGLASARSRDDAPSPLFLRERDRPDGADGTREDTDAEAAPEVAPGQTPWPESEWMVGDADAPGPQPRTAEPEGAAARAETERRTAEDRAVARRRAEEIMAAPEPEPTLDADPGAVPEPERAEQTSPADVPTQPSRVEDLADVAAEKAHRRAGRHLRGRAQSRTIARRMQRARAAAEQARAAAEQTRTEPEQARVEAEPSSPPAHGYGAGLPAPQEETRPEPDPSRPRPRPHAAPWDLPPVARTGDTGVPESAPATAPSLWDEPDDTAAADTPSGGATAPDRRDDEPSPAADPGEPDTWTADLSADLPSLAEQIRASAAAKPPLELDHGTGEHDSFTDVTRPRPEERPAEPEPAPAEPEAPGDAATAESSVGGSSGEDTSAPPRKSPLQLDHGTGAWEELTALRGASAEPAEPEPAPERPAPATPPAPPPKPPLELDHGTGEHDSFTDVTRPRRTEEELAAIEQAALRRRGPTGPAEHTDAATDDTPADDGADRGAPKPPSRQSSRLARGVRSSGSTPGGDTPDPREREERPAAPAAERGLLTRFVDNARRVGEALTPARGTATPRQDPAEASPQRPADHKPDLQLDHGTGEQQLFSGSTTPGGGSTPPAAPSDGGPVPAHAENSPGGGTRGWRRLARVVTGGNSVSRPQLPPAELERLRTPLNAPRGLVVLGCTGGAGQTVTTLMLGHTLAAYRDDRVVAVDINPGPQSLSRRVRTETPETLTSLLANTDALHAYSTLRGYTSRTPSGLEVVATLDDPYVQTLDDRDYVTLTGTLRRHYQITLLDPAATGVARALPVVDGLVLVAPASADAARSVALTFEWLDGHGYADLRSRAIVVINGVSRRSLADVDAAEQVARGNCRAIVRVPWDDHIAAARSVIDVKALRQTTRRAHAALAAVVAAHLAAHTTEPKR
ncbi:hypothetical protein GCM10022630_24050 [Thermobifida alba]|uniref:TcpE family conjugal transfer membrane protein n=2 Tax=Thermobifida alba TaxID=53522 RepID=UPI0031E956A6